MPQWLASIYPWNRRGFHLTRKQIFIYLLQLCLSIPLHFSDDITLTSPGSSVDSPDSPKSCKSSHLCRSPCLIRRILSLAVIPVEHYTIICKHKPDFLNPCRFIPHVVAAQTPPWGLSVNSSCRDKISASPEPWIIPSQMICGSREWWKNDPPRWVVMRSERERERASASAPGTVHGASFSGLDAEAAGSGMLPEMKTGRRRLLGASEMFAHLL